MPKYDAYQVLWKTADGRLRLKHHRVGAPILVPPGEGFRFRGVTAFVNKEVPAYLTPHAAVFTSAQRELQD